MKKKHLHKKSIKKAEKSSASPISIRRFAITYILLMGAFFFLIGFAPFQKIIDINGLYTRGIVVITSKILGIINIPCTVQGSVLQLPAIALDVRFGCNGLEAVMIYSVAVLAFPSSWKHKLVGIFTGFMVIQIINVLRIAVLAYAGVYLKNIFEYIHIYIAQGIMIAISLGVFFLYLNYAKTSEKATS